ncbi:MAG: hypothetical protein AB1489_17235, partial [Acidobacteriota bacterium]
WPALFCYLAMMFQALRTLIGFLRQEGEKIEWCERGLVLGAFGALIGFNTSALVHFNFGDGEVIMVLWLVLGLGMAVILKHADKRAKPPQ